MAGTSDGSYMAFPFRVDKDGVATSDRARHVREQIEQVLYTNPYERVYRPEFGAGIRALIFEPNTPVLEEVVKKRLMSSLAEALQGEVDPRTLTIEVDKDAEGSGERLRIVISYTLAAIGQLQRHELLVGPGE